MGSLIKLMVLLGFILLLFHMTKRFIEKLSNKVVSHDAIELRPCEYCGVHVSNTDAVIKKGKVFCSIKHSKQNT